MFVSPISARGMGDFARQLEENFGIGAGEFQAVFVENAGYIVEAARRLESRKHQHYEIEVDYSVDAEDLLTKEYLHAEYLRRGLNFDYNLKHCSLMDSSEPGKKRISVATICMGHEVGVTELPERLKKMGYRLATTIEYLTFFHCHPDEVETHHVHTLLDGKYNFHIDILRPNPALQEKTSCTVCELEYKEPFSGWSKIVWFLAVKEETA